LALAQAQQATLVMFLSLLVAQPVGRVVISLLPLDQVNKVATWP
jgi:hypothetical protein